ncbi:MAG: Unknown protein [uncultured Sulfurovum sp.]|uniref:Pesticidal crystal protein Cry22Aa Ig-like domain-containing protein n=1 Tax=uncultured Sulfurovum sp. TaxID=269237 RepID=A0A6S6U2M4_9BACT|nr:MAG: Unknown protein [uncultured Sulfurovum sp.]
MGDPIQTIEVGMDYIELGAVAIDDLDGNISGNIIMDTSEVNTDAIGTYTVTYNVMDTAGNSADEVLRTINVVESNITNITDYNQQYHDKMILEGKPTQETPWGFQEISIENKIEHVVSSIEEYRNLVSTYSSGGNWADGKTHIINFMAGTYELPLESSYYVALVPSRTIIEGAGMGNTIFKAIHEIPSTSTSHFRKLFNLEYASHDVAVRGISFYNETSDNKWGLFHSNGSRNRENYLFENIEFDDVFGAIGMSNYTSNFITFRGLRKRIGNTTQRILDNFTIPVPSNYQFNTQNNDDVKLAGQIGIRTGNSTVFHDCILGDNISATIDAYNNYIEIVGVEFINPLHDHSIKCPNGNHLYIHDSSFEINYSTTLIEDSGFWNPTFFTHEGGGLANYHFKNLNFKKLGQISCMSNGQSYLYSESEPYMIYDNRAANISGDMVWEGISFDGYSVEHEVVGYPNVQTDQGFEAINYTSFTAESAQMKSGNNNSRGDYTINIETRLGNSQQDIKGVYSWGLNTDGLIDYPRENRTFIGTKSDTESKPYVQMIHSSVKDIYNALIE